MDFLDLGYFFLSRRGDTGHAWFGPSSIGSQCSLSSAGPSSVSRCMLN